MKGARTPGREAPIRSVALYSAMPADAPLVNRLYNPDYMNVILDGRVNLEELIAEPGAGRLTMADPSRADTDRNMPGFRALMKLPTLLDQALRSLSETRRAAKSNRML